MATSLRNRKQASVEPEAEWKVRQRRRILLLKMGTTTLAMVLLAIYLMPMAYAFVTSAKTAEQASDPDAPILPAAPATFEFEGEEYDILAVPLPDGEVRNLALVQPGRQQSEFVDPDNPEAGTIVWEGNWRQLEPVYESAWAWSNYQDAWDFINFPRMLFWTLLYAFVTLVGAVSASALVAYGFARFRFPGKNILFIILIGTIILPPAVALIPKYTFFTRIGWVGTWLPLIVPLMFGNAYNVFLLRQYFLTIPREMEQAASVDGAGPFRTFLQVILPQAVPALTAVSLFHFFFAWNDFFDPLIYLTGNRDIVPISVGLTFFSGTYEQNPNLIMAASFIALVIPLAIFFFSQRIFLSGIVVSGAEK
jgi:multiple sugar transport system permease protein